MGVHRKPRFLRIAVTMLPWVPSFCINPEIAYAPPFHRWAGIPAPPNRWSRTGPRAPPQPTRDASTIAEEFENTSNCKEFLVRMAKIESGGENNGPVRAGIPLFSGITFSLRPRLRLCACLRSRMAWRKGWDFLEKRPQGSPVVCLA